MSKVFSLMIVALLLLAALPLTHAQDSCVNSVVVWDNDSLTSIAAKHTVSASELAARNNLAPNARLLVGQVLCLDGLAGVSPAPTSAPALGSGELLPPPQPSIGVSATPVPNIGAGGVASTPEPSATPQLAETLPPAPSPEPTTTATPAPPVLTFQRGQLAIAFPNWRTHLVVAGETLTSIAAQYQVTLDVLIANNNIPANGVIFAGEALLIPPSNTTPPAIGGGAPPTTQPMPPTPTGVFRPAEGTIPVISIVPNVARSGATVTVTGSNYPGRQTVNLYLEKRSLGLLSAALETVTTQDDGTFSTTLTIPATWPDGSPVNQPTVSISGYTASGGYWAMNFFVNQ